MRPALNVNENNEEAGCKRLCNEWMILLNLVSIGLIVEHVNEGRAVIRALIK